MINPLQLKLHDIGRAVIYHRPNCVTERGVLTSWTDKHVFVRFRGPNGEMCLPEDVSFESNECTCDECKKTRRARVFLRRRGIAGGDW